MVVACVEASSATVTTAATAHFNHNQTGFAVSIGGGGGCKKDMEASGNNPSTISKGVTMTTAVVDQLRQQLQLVVEKGDLSASNACAGQLENAVLSKDTLEATRIGRFVNDIRKQTAQRWPDFSKRCRALIKQWQKVAEYRPSSSCEGSSNGGTPQLVSPALKRGLTPRLGAVTIVGKRATPQQQRVTSTGLCPPDSRQITGRTTSSTLSSSSSVSPLENGVATAATGSYAPLPPFGKKISPHQHVAAVQQHSSMHKSASVGASLSCLGDSLAVKRTMPTMLNGIAEDGAVIGGAHLAACPSYADVTRELGAAQPSTTAPPVPLKNNPPLTLKLKRSANGVQRLTSSMSPPPSDNGNAEVSTSTSIVGQQQSRQLQQQQSVLAARKNVQSTAQLVAQLSMALPQHVGIDLNNKNQQQQQQQQAGTTAAAQNAVAKKICSEPIPTNADGTKRRHQKRKVGRASEERMETILVKQMKGTIAATTDTGEMFTGVKDEKQWREMKTEERMEQDEDKTKTVAIDGSSKKTTTTLDKGAKRGRKKKDKQQQRDEKATDTKFNWFAELPLDTGASTSSMGASVEGQPAVGGIPAQVYASPMRSFVLPAHERTLLLLPYMDIGLPDWRVHNFPQSEQFLFPEPGEWHKKP